MYAFIEGMAFHESVSAKGYVRDQFRLSTLATEFNRPHIRKLLDWTASVTSDSDVRMALTTAINQDPQLLPAVLLGIAQWSEHHDATSFDKILDVTPGIESLPSWFPAEAFAATIRRNLPHVEPADEDDSARYNDDVDRLASQVLWLAES